jgi:hypothetical protein
MLLRMLMLWSVRRLGVFHIEKPAGQALWQESEPSGVPEKHRQPVDSSDN